MHQLVQLSTQRWLEIRRKTRFWKEERWVLFFRSLKIWIPKMGYYDSACRKGDRVREYGLWTTKEHCEAIRSKVASYMLQTALYATYSVATDELTFTPRDMHCTVESEREQFLISWRNFNAKDPMLLQLDVLQEVSSWLSYKSLLFGLQTNANLHSQGSL